MLVNNKRMLACTVTIPTSFVIMACLKEMKMRRREGVSFILYHFTLSIKIGLSNTLKISSRLRVGFSSIICDGSVGRSQEAKFSTSREFPKISGNINAFIAGSPKIHAGYFAKQIKNQHTP